MKSMLMTYDSHNEQGRMNEWAPLELCTSRGLLCVSAAHQACPSAKLFLQPPEAVRARRVGGQPAVLHAGAPIRRLELREQAEYRGRAVQRAAPAGGRGRRMRQGIASIQAGRTAPVARRPAAGQGQAQAAAHLPAAWSRSDELLRMRAGPPRAQPPGHPCRCTATRCACPAMARGGAGSAAVALALPARAGRRSRRGHLTSLP